MMIEGRAGSRVQKWHVLAWICVAGFHTYTNNMSCMLSETVAWASPKINHTPPPDNRYGGTDSRHDTGNRLLILRRGDKLGKV